MKLIITIDTEEDNWHRYSTTDNPVSNIERVPALQSLFDRFGVRPTYLVTYPVATNPRSVDILKRILQEEKCEIGMHCHPWNTPPFEEEINNFNSMLCNLPEALILKKLRTLHEAICENMGIIPVSFRAGRWGFNSTVARVLCHLGYRVDTSVSPFVDWGQYHGPDFTDFPLHPYRFDHEDIAVRKDTGALLEVPATVGFLHNNFERCQKWTEYLESKIAKKLRLNGLLSKLKLLNKVWLSPEHADAGTMIKLTERLKQMNSPYINFSFHSASLIAGLSSFTINRADEIKFMRRIEDFLVYVSAERMKPLTLSQLEKQKIF